MLYFLHAHIIQIKLELIAFFMQLLYFFGSFLLLLPAGLAAEHFGSRRVIFCGLLCREATRVLLILGEGVPAMAAMQLSYAGAVAVDAVYFAHIFAAAPPSAYAALTSIVYAAYHGGNVLGSLLGQGALALWPALVCVRAHQCSYRRDHPAS